MSNLPTFHPLGSDAIIVRFALQLSAKANAAALVYSREVLSNAPKGLIEAVPSLASVLVRFDPSLTSRSDFCEALGGLSIGRDWLRIEPPAPLRRWTIPAAFGGEQGPQLEEAATKAGLSQAQAVQDLTTAKLRVLAIGFAPGQPYLGLLPAAWNFPRQSALTPQVPAGALVVALSQVVMFANPSATGWRLIGQTPFRLFRPESDDPFPLQVGDEVVFERVSALDYSVLLSGENGGAHVGVCEVLS